MNQLDPFSRRVLGMIQSHLQTMYNQTDLRVEVSQASPTVAQVKVWDGDTLKPRFFMVEVTEIKS